MRAEQSVFALPLCMEGNALPQADRIRLDKWCARPAGHSYKVTGTNSSAGKQLGLKLTPSQALALPGTVFFPIATADQIRGGVVVIVAGKSAYVHSISVDPRLETAISLRQQRCIFGAILDRWGSAEFVADTRMAEKWNRVLPRWGFSITRTEKPNVGSWFTVVQE